MPLLTLISLMIGIFGATLSAILTIKHFGDGKLLNYTKEAKQCLANIDDLAEASHTVMAARATMRIMRYLHRSWGLLILIPIIIFAFWAFRTAFFAFRSTMCAPYFTLASESSHVADPNSAPSKKVASTQNIQTHHIKSPWFLRRTTAYVITWVDCGCIIVALLLLIIIAGLMIFMRFLHRIVIQTATQDRSVGPNSGPPTHIRRKI